jgi:hypothetical protein
LYPDPLQCLVQLGLEDRYSLLVPRSTPMSSAGGGWRIGTLRLYPDPLQCLMQRGLEDRYICLYLPVHCSLSHTAVVGGSVQSVCTQIHSNVLYSGVWRIGTFCLYLPVHFNGTYCGVGGSVHSACTQIHSSVSHQLEFTLLGLGPLLGYVAFRTLL